MTRYSLADLQVALVADFPELAEDLAEDAARPRMQLGRFALFTQEAKGRLDWATYERCIAFVHRFLTAADGDLEGAIDVAYLEHLDFDGPRGPAAWGRLTPDLQRAWTRVAKDNAERRALPRKQRGRRS
jgi:hypothetical protein